MKKFIIIFLLLSACLPVFSQTRGQTDSLVILMSSKSVHAVDIEGASYRKVIGPARFLHNNTYLLCDTALWNLETRIIDAWGNVSLLQDETVLTSDRLKYLVDDDLAQFRGSVVQLEDKDHNTLRTRHLDYNTKDSIAVFENGGAMRDKDGQIIESRKGRYDSKVKIFNFIDDVNMFSDTMFVKTTELEYHSDDDLALFNGVTDVWDDDDDMLTARRGWYNRRDEIFFFEDNVHLTSKDQEGWSDTLFFYRLTSDVEMLGNAQITDTTRNAFGLAGKIRYENAWSRVTMTRDPAVISQTKAAEGQIDTVYLGANRIIYETLYRFEVDSSAVAESVARVEAMSGDPVGEYRRKAAEEAAKLAEEERLNDPNYKAQQEALARKAAGESTRKQTGETTPEKKADEEKLKEAPVSDMVAVEPPETEDVLRPEPVDSVDVPNVSGDFVTDSLSVVPDTLSAAADSVQMPPVLDSTKVGFMYACKDVKVYKKDIQVVCDTLIYSELDSIARLYTDPLVWQDGRRQYSADSIYVAVADGSIDKAYLMSNAFIHIQEDDTHFDQIRSTEMLAYFDVNGNLTRFDGLGGATTLFFIEENETLATVNKADAKMLSATFKDNEIQRLQYYDAVQNDATPLAQMTAEDQILKGYNWQIGKCPEDRFAVTPLSLRPSERKAYEARPKTKFRETAIYFPGYMKDIRRQIAYRDSMNVVLAKEKELKRLQEERMRLDSLAVADSLARLDSLNMAVKDSLSAVSDSLAFTDSLAVDSLSVVEQPVDALPLTKEQLKKQEQERRKAEKEARRKAKQEAKEKKWAELDQRDSLKAERKEAKRIEKERKRKLRALKAQLAQEEKDRKALEKYIRYYEKRKAREDARAAKKAARKKK